MKSARFGSTWRANLQVSALRLPLNRFFQRRPSRSPGPGYRVRDQMNAAAADQAGR